MYMHTSNTFILHTHVMYSNAARWAHADDQNGFHQKPYMLSNNSMVKAIFARGRMI